MGISNQKRGLLALSIGGLILGASAGNLRAAVFGQVDDFQDGTTAEWGGSATSNIADSGPAGTGDNALEVNSSNKIVTFNSIQWAGDYSAAGITAISMDVRTSDVSDLTLHLGISNGSPQPGGGGDTYVTMQNITVPNDGDWHTILFNIGVADWTASSGNTSTPPDVAMALANVSQLRIIDNSNGADFTGVSSGGSFVFDLDNITAVPEPGSMMALLGLGGVVLATRRRLQRA